MRLTLTKGHTALIDDADAQLASGKWSALVTRGGAVYAVSARGLLHRLLMRPKRNMVVDHINGDTLDNRRRNLRVCTHAENVRNSTKHRPRTSRFKGVSYCLRDRVWRAHIRYNYKSFALGTFHTEDEAAQAYDEAARTMFKAFAKPNGK